MGHISHPMNILLFHRTNLTDNINHNGRLFKEKYLKAIIGNITFMSRRFPASKIFFITDQYHILKEKALNSNITLINLQTTTVISDRHLGFLKNYFHLYQNGYQKLITAFIERYFYLYDVLVSHNIDNFISLDSDCILLEDASAHDYDKIGINHPPRSEDCWANALMCSTTHLNKFLDFICSFYEGVQQHITEAQQQPKSTPSLRIPLKEREGIKYINSFFDKPRKGLCDMGLWYLFQKQNPDLFVNNLIINSEGAVHDLGLGYKPNEYGNFTIKVTQKHDVHQNLETVQIKEIIYTKDAPCFKEKGSGKLIKIQSLHFTPGTIKLDMIPFIKEYEKIYGLPH